ncbi:MAG: DNA repair protein RecN [Bacteroidales bacterium]|jgi:DNA repair protein RecN (Recombination protein N)|nr:DNA repair protein RecN [Bacteroidales bacterium]
MLTKLTVSNYALIHELSVEFPSGLNMVTGETGAGKSIILGALGLILGNRADVSSLKNKYEKCVVEGIFEIKNYSLEHFFKENDLDYDAVTILRREIVPSGKSRAFINDTPVNLKVMQELGLKLIDIHSQHQNLELVNQKYQLNVIDVVSGSFKIFDGYKSQFSAVVNLKKQLSELVKKSEKANSDLDYYQFQFNQLEEAKLNKNEQEELEIELEKLVHAEEIKTNLQEILALLDNEQFSVIQNIKDTQRIFGKIQNFIPEAPGLSQRLQNIVFELRDIREETEQLAEKTEHNPDKIELINNRLNLIYSLQQKHRVSTVNELIELKNTLEAQINKAVGYSNEINSVENELKTNLLELKKRADILTESRKKVFPYVEKMVVDVLRQLGIEKAKFIITHETLPEFTQTGQDSVSFLFSANTDTQPVEISKIASGGEMSRLMLAIKNLLRNSKSLPTVIFDEIDTGISGEVAIKMGNILKTFSTSTQIINITHLPQIAAKGDTHFLVYKYDENGKTYTSIRQLNKNERIDELAKMVGGNEITDTTLKTAKELIGK